MKIFTFFAHDHTDIIFNASVLYIQSFAFGIISFNVMTIYPIHCNMSVEIEFNVC